MKVTFEIEDKEAIDFLVDFSGILNTADNEEGVCVSAVLATGGMDGAAFTPDTQFWQQVESHAKRAVHAHVRHQQAYLEGEIGKLHRGLGGRVNALELWHVEHIERHQSDRRKGQQ